MLAPPAACGAHFHVHRTFFSRFLVIQIFLPLLEICITEIPLYIEHTCYWEFNTCQHQQLYTFARNLQGEE